MRLSSYLSNLKWLVISLDRLVGEVENWVSVLAYFLSPVQRFPLAIVFRNGDILTIPPDYIFEAVAETLLLNVYDFKQMPPGAVVVDIGASVGDFALLASSSPKVRVYSFEPSLQTFPYARSNVESNRRSVRLFNLPADGRTLDTILDTYGESNIDFLKVDCDGCEYEFLLDCSSGSLNKVRRIAMEIHQTQEFPKNSLIGRLLGAGFIVTEKKAFGGGHYLYASRKESLGREGGPNYSTGNH